MVRRKISIICGVLLFGSVSVMSYAQTIVDDFFDSVLSYNAYELKGSVFPGGGLAKFSLGKWNYQHVFRSLALDGLLPDTVNKYLVTSNQIDFRMLHEDIGSYVVNGVEAYFSRPLSLSTLGYKMANQLSDIVNSSYYIIVFLQQGENGATANWRLIAYLDDIFSIAGEIIGYDQVYFIRSMYQKLPHGGNILVDSQIPSFIVIERSDQSVLGIINILGQKIIWVLDDLSYDDQTVVSFASGVFFSMRFRVGNDGILRAYHNRALRLRQKDTNTDIIDENLILSPDQLVPGTFTNDDVPKNNKDNKDNKDEQ